MPESTRLLPVGTSRFPRASYLPTLVQWSDSLTHTEFLLDPSINETKDGYGLLPYRFPKGSRPEIGASVLNDIALTAAAFPQACFIHSKKSPGRTHSKFSLRIKLVVSIGVIITLASVPLIWLGYRDVYDHSIRAATDRFGSLTRMLEEDLRISYLNGQTLVTCRAAIEDWTEKGELAANDNVFEYMEKQWETHTAVMDGEGAFLRLSPLVREVWRDNTRDWLGVSFRDIVADTDRNFYRDFRTFYRLNDAKGRNRPYLVVVRKVGDHIAVVMQNLDYLETLEGEDRRTLIERLQGRVDELGLDASTGLIVLSASGSVLVQSGRDVLSPAMTTHPEIAEGVKNAGFVSGIFSLRGERYLYTARRFKALDWTIGTTVPVSEITEPAKAYARNLAAIALAIFAATSLLGMVLVTRLLIPLRQVADTAKSLAAVNFVKDNSQEGLKELVEKLPSERTDEIGLVAMAFRHMILALQKNIRELKASLARQHGIEGELKAAREIQRNMLPVSDERFRSKNFEAAALMEAAKEVGGDFYDVVQLPGGRRALILGDVSGKGVSEALMMSVTLTLVRNALANGFEPATVLKTVNDQLAANNPNCMFVTLWVGIYDPETGWLVYANGGHCPPVVLPANAEEPMRWLRDVSGPVVGVFDEAEYEGLATHLTPGEAIYIYSDGVSEAMNEERSLFGEEGIAAVFADRTSNDPHGLIDAVLEAVIRHRKTVPQSDDITMLVCQRKAEG